MHNTCIAAFRNQNRGRYRSSHGAAGKPGRNHAAKLTAMAGRDLHQCVRRRAHDGAVPAFYTLCGHLVPESNVAETSLPVTCPRCLRRGGAEH